MRIVVAGLAATYPLGGVFWDYMQYVLGLRRLGHDVLYLEDTGQWSYDPERRTFVESGVGNAAYLQTQLARAGPDLSQSWFYRDGAGNTYGRDWADVVGFCRSADVFLHVSASCIMRDEYRAARVAFIDSDPMYTQANVPDYLAGTCSDGVRGNIEWLRDNHDVHFTFAENIGAPDCKVPSEVFRWKTTRQPIVLDQFRPARLAPLARRRVLTTVASWETKQGGPKVGGVQYFGKNAEFERFMTLPASAAAPLEVAMSGAAPVDRMRESGWRVIDAWTVSRDPWRYRAYLADSLGEFSVAKNAYVASRSGWFSCRSACYLALGVPVVVQDTGFSEWLGGGEGVLPFTDAAGAAEAIARLAAEPERHARAAIEIAEAVFDSDRVLTRLLEDATTSL